LWFCLAVGLSGKAFAVLQYSFLEEACPAEFSLKATLQVSGPWRPEAFAEVVFHFQESTSYRAVRLWANRVEILQVAQGQPQLLEGTSDWQPALAGERIELTLQRRAWQITLLANGQRVVQAYDRAVPGGRAGTATSGEALRFTEVVLQPTEAVYFADDFTRIPEESGLWETLAGTFAATRVRGEQTEKGAAASANRFAWQGKAEAGRGLCVAGYWFWEAYLVQASVRPEAAGWVGLAALVQDDRNFVAFRWGPERKQLIKVVAGQVTVLAEKPGGYQAGQWYRLGLQAWEGRLAGMIDGAVVCLAADPAFGQGRIGLYLEDCASGRFDDVRVEPVEGFQEDFSVASRSKWQDLEGRWETRTVPAGRTPLTYRTPVEGREALTVAGPDHWQNYVVGVDVKPAAQGRAGLAFGVRGRQHYHLLQVEPRSPPEPSRVQLLRRRGDQVTLLQETPWPVAVERWQRLKVRTWHGHLQAYLDDQPVADVFDPDPAVGAIGCYAAGAGEPKFDNVFLWFPRPADPSAPVAEPFAREDSMAAWATPQGQWRPQSGAWWHRGTFLSDAALSARFPNLAGADGTATLLLHGRDDLLSSGYALTLQVDTQGQQVAFYLLREGQIVASTTKSTAEIPPDSVLHLYREGSFLGSTLNDSPLLHFHDAAPLSGRQVACQAQGIDLPLANVKAWCATLLDDTFTQAPTEWWAARGHWEIVARWPCDARWSWLGGLDSETPILWSKRSYLGDVTVEAWVALYMDNPADMEVGYKHPSDLNLTICGDGRDLGSGYSGLFAGWNNTRTALLRKAEVKVATDQLRMVNPSRRNLDFQRHWYYLRVEKEGRRIRYSVDGNPPLEWEDPEPLPGGQIALWTSHDNGLMVARVRIWYQQASEVQPLPAIPPPAPATPGGWIAGPSEGRWALVSDFEEGIDGWTQRDLPEGPFLAVDDATAAHGRRSLRVTNPVTGGHFSLWAGVKEFDAVRFPRLRFAYRLGPEVKINWYLKTQGRWHVLGFTAPDQPGPGVEPLGMVEDVVADGAWHEAEVDLLARLREKYPEAASLPVQDLCLASPRVDYLRSGIGGNPLGATYHLDHVRLIGAEGTTAEDAAAVVKR